jgi:catechol 2,3-dioxygenase-like lactoylglutathione lyase family enzyme
MTTTPTETGAPDQVRCGCCGNVRPAGKATELMSTPGVYLCSNCAVWAAARLTRVGVVFVGAVRAGRALRRLRQRLRRIPRRGGAGIVGATPVLVSTDLERSCAYFTRLGFQLVGSHEGYLVMHADGVELHLSTRTVASAPVDAYVQVGDAGALRKRLTHDGVPGLGPVEDQPWGMREFVATDPDGNRIRIGSPLSWTTGRR